LAAQFDVVIRNGRVIDGSGAEAVEADVAIVKDRIVAIGRVAAGSGELELDISGKAVAPGFIDAHTHDDRALLVMPDMAAKASQGVTTVITGNCGISLAPLVLDRPPPPPLDLIGDAEGYAFASFGAYLDALDERPAALNAACLVGHSTLRVGAMADLDRPATDEELACMRARLRSALDDGAIGLSSGTFYPPASAAPTEEVAALAALDDGEHVEKSLRGNAEGIECLTRELGALGIEVWHSDANFLLARTGAAVYEKLLRDGVIVRPLHGFGMPDHVRITVGLPEENERVVKALRRIREASA